ncbi:MAG: hypothetical protein ACYSW8_32710, partial [Planctomycetota bacterium]
TTPSSGGTACAGSDTARTCDAESECGEGVKKETADHKSFQSPTYQSYWSSATLKVDWRTEAMATHERDCINGRNPPGDRGNFELKYSLNGGSGWSNFSGFPWYGFNLAKTGTVTVGLSTSQNIANVRVRIESHAEAPACATGACCYGTLFCDCRIDTEAGCSPGTYQGDGTSCDPCWHEGCDGPPGP